ncbi:serine/threonine protein kinase [Anopheles sinensis]|uniref:Serine/threonine protein kinase n=1 Tax=Anopheles sinensis TaxID=74873 RepID=A0A084VU17_ANOSI|nr:serine/threonine protein kinase [Anopheles sinensis]
MHRKQPAATVGATASSSWLIFVTLVPENLAVDGTVLMRGFGRDCSEKEEEEATGRGDVRCVGWLGEAAPHWFRNSIPNPIENPKTNPIRPVSFPVFPAGNHLTSMLI